MNCKLFQAALYGCGCWAENDELTGVGVGVSTSGCGEHLTKTLLARECAHCLNTAALENPTEALYDVFNKKFLGMVSNSFCQIVCKSLNLHRYYLRFCAHFLAQLNK